MEEELQEILDNMINGEWKTASNLFKSINPSSRDFGMWIKDNCNKNEVHDFVMLGFNCREYIPKSASNRFYTYHGKGITE